MLKTAKYTIMICLTFFLFTSCAKKKFKSSTSLKILVGGSIAPALLAGGGMVWGKSLVNADKFAKIIPPGGGDIELDLTKGDWSFAAVIWDGTLKLRGTPRCDRVAVNIEGSSTNVPLNLNNSKCNDSELSTITINVGGTEKFPFLEKIESCNDLTNVSDYSSLCSDNKKGHFTSFKVALSEYEISAETQQPPNFSGIFSACYNVNSDMTNGIGSITANLNPSIPLGSPQFPIGTTIRAFYGSTSCEDDKGHHDFYFDHGMYQTFPDSINHISANNLKLFLKSDPANICTNISPNEFASGDETNPWSGPFGICIEEQFNLIGTNFSINKLNTFSLLSDLNFLTIPAVVIGNDITGDAGEKFEGDFYGNDHILSYLEINAENQDIVGLFRKTGNAGLQKIQDFSIVHTQVNCDYDGGYDGLSNPSDGSNNCLDTGMLIGRSEGDLELKNIFLHGYIEGRQGVGALVGAHAVGLTNLSIENSHVNVWVHAQQDVGGFVGMISAPSTIENSSYHGRVTAKTKQYGNHIGGLVGYYQGAQAHSISRVRTSGLIGGKHSVGGIIGKFSSTDTLNMNDSYSTAHVFHQESDYGGDGAIGGLIGMVYGGNYNLSNLFSAKGELRCGSPCTTAGGIIGQEATIPNLPTFNTPTEIYHERGLIGKLTGDANTGTGGTDIKTLISPPFDASPWVNHGGNHDIPRLEWETALEGKLPYLSRPCSTLQGLSIQEGSGNQEDPKWVCTNAQFTSMATGTHYILMNHLDLSSLGDTEDSLIKAGEYILDGNGYQISSINIVDPALPTLTNSNYGIFEELTGNSSITNLEIAFSNIHFDQPGADVDQCSFGILAGKTSPNTKIENIKIIASSLNVQKIEHTNTASYIGGVVGYNQGEIKNSFFSTFNYFLNFKQLNAPSPVDLYIGGIAGFNNGLIKFNQSKQNFTYVNNAAADDRNFDAYKYVGGLVGHNGTSGAIEQNIVHDLQITLINNSVTGSDGSFGLFASINDGNINNNKAKLGMLDIQGTSFSAGYPSFKDVFTNNNSNVNNNFIEFGNLGFTNQPAFSFTGTYTYCFKTGTSPATNVDSFCKDLNSIFPLPIQVVGNILEIGGASAAIAGFNIEEMDYNPLEQAPPIWLIEDNNSMPELWNTMHTTQKTITPEIR